MCCGAETQTQGQRDVGFCYSRVSYLVHGWVWGTWLGFPGSEAVFIHLRVPRSHQLPKESGVSWASVNPCGLGTRRASGSASTLQSSLSAGGEEAARALSVSPKPCAPTCGEPWTVSSQESPSETSCDCDSVWRHADLSHCFVSQAKNSL